MKFSLLSENGARVSSVLKRTYDNGLNLVFDRQFPILSWFQHKSLVADKTNSCLIR